MSRRAGLVRAASRRTGSTGIEIGAGARDYWRMLYPKDPGGAYVASTTRIRWAGMHHAGQAPVIGSATALQGTVGTDRYYAIAEWFPVAGTLKRLGFFLQKASQQVAGRTQLHIYTAGVCTTVGNFLGWPYPGTLALSGTLWAMTVSGTAVGALWTCYEDLVSYAIPAQTLLWFVYRANTQAAGAGDKLTISRDSQAPWMGYTAGGATSAADNLTAGCGYIHAHTFASGAATTFPSSAPAILNASSNLSSFFDIPAIGYGFAPD
jgi:hypothetical protein